MVLLDRINNSKKKCTSKVMNAIYLKMVRSQSENISQFKMI